MQFNEGENTKACLGNWWALYIKILPLFVNIVRWIPVHIWGQLKEISLSCVSGILSPISPYSDSLRGIPCDSCPEILTHSNIPGEKWVGGERWTHTHLFKTHSEAGCILSYWDAFVPWLSHMNCSLNLLAWLLFLCHVWNYFLHDEPPTQPSQ